MALPPDKVLRMLDELRASWDVTMNADRDGYALSIVNRSQVFTYRGKSLPGLIARAYAGERDD